MILVAMIVYETFYCGLHVVKDLGISAISWNILHFGFVGKTKFHLLPLITFFVLIMSSCKHTVRHGQLEPHE